MTRMTRRFRVAMYSHDTMGLGHMRRNQLIAHAFVSSRLQPTILLIVGAREASAFARPAGVDCLSLPALHKEGEGDYRARSLDLSLHELIAIRSKAIYAALEAFDPDVLIVDNVPRGAVGELNPVMQMLHARGRTRFILGLRDVLDDAAVVDREWRDAANEEVITTYFDAIWVYGDPAVYDLVREYRFSPAVAAKVRYTGYLDQQVRLQSAWSVDSRSPATVQLPPGPLGLCMVGGGQDGARLAEAFVQADLPPQTTEVILMGPYMPSGVRRRLRRYVAANPRIRIMDFIPEPAALLRRADRVIGMGGYNTVCEVLSFEKRALIVPRVRPRREQLLRAERLRDLGLLDMLHPDEVTPRAPRQLAGA